MSKTTPWIEWVEDEDASGQIGEIYQKWKEANPEREHFPDILKCFAHDGDILQGLLDFCYPLQFAEGSLTRWHKELIATFVSAINRCRY